MNGTFVDVHVFDFINDYIGYSFNITYTPYILQVIYLQVEGVYKFAYVHRIFAILVEKKIQIEISELGNQIKVAIEGKPLFEILNESPLWSIEFVEDQLKFFININIDPSLINEYLDKSSALNFLLSTEFDRLQKFNKFDSNKSYFPDSDMYEPPNNFKIKLYEILIIFSPLKSS